MYAGVKARNYMEVKIQVFLIMALQEVSVYGLRNDCVIIWNCSVEWLDRWTFRNKDSFPRWGVVSPSPNHKLEDHPLSAVRDCLFNIFAAILHIGGRSYILNLRNLRERDRWRDPGLDGRIILRWIFRNRGVGVWTGLSWLRLETGGGHLWML
jgi:hypothetical protein